MKTQKVEDEFGKSDTFDELLLSLFTKLVKLIDNLQVNAKVL